MSELLTISFLGNALSALRELRDEEKRKAGYQLDRVQQGLEPEDWKPMKSIGPGVREIRIREKSGAYRVIYVTRQTNRLYVLHAFQKKTEKTAKPDLELAKTRYRSLLNKGDLL